jgi:hypothetical protein
VAEHASYMRRLSVSASNLGQLDACAHVGSSDRKETKTETKPDPKMLNGSARGDHQRLFQQHRPNPDIAGVHIEEGHRCGADFLFRC